MLNILDLSSRKTAEQLNIPESIVEKVLQHKWKAVYDAQYLHNSVEDSGLGTFKVRIKVAVNRIKRLDSMMDRLVRELQDGKDTMTQRAIDRNLRVLEQLIEEKKYVQSKI